MFEALAAVRRIRLFENDRRCRQCCRSLAGNTGTRIIGCDLVAGSAHCHDFRRTPPGVIRVGISYLIVIYLVFRMTFDKVIAHPLDITQDVLGLACFFIRITVLIYGPCEHCSRISHGKIELYVVSRIVPSAGKIQSVICAVIKTRVSAPVASDLCRQISGPL